MAWVVAVVVVEAVSVSGKVRLEGVRRIRTVGRGAMRGLLGSGWTIAVDAVIDAMDVMDVMDDAISGGVVVSVTKACDNKRATRHMRARSPALDRSNHGGLPGRWKDLQSVRLFD